MHLKAPTCPFYNRNSAISPRSNHYPEFWDNCFLVFLYICNRYVQIFNVLLHFAWFWPLYKWNQSECILLWFAFFCCCCLAVSFGSHLWCCKELKFTYFHCFSIPYFTPQQEQSSKDIQPTSLHCIKPFSGFPILGIESQIPHVAYQPPRDLAPPPSQVSSHSLGWSPFPWCQQAFPFLLAFAHT